MVTCSGICGVDEIDERDEGARLAERNKAGTSEKPSDTNSGKLRIIIPLFPLMPIVTVVIEPIPAELLQMVQAGAATHGGGKQLSEHEMRERPRTRSQSGTLQSIRESR